MKKDYQLLNKEDIKRRQNLSAFIKYFLLFTSAAILTWKVFKFIDALNDINELIKETNFLELKNLFIQTKETIIKDFIFDVLWLLTISIVLLIQIIISDDNTENIDSIDNTNQQIIENLHETENQITNNDKK